jgi:hypothetical protein
MQDTTKETSPGQEATVTPTARLDPVVRARAVADAFAKSAQLSDDAAKELQGLVLGAIDERFEEAQDIHLGRVLGSALATMAMM